MAKADVNQPVDFPIQGKVMGRGIHENGRNHPALRLKPPVSVSLSSDRPNMGHEPENNSGKVRSK